MTRNYLNFFSCNLSPPLAGSAVEGSDRCTLDEITVPDGTPVIRLDLMPDVQNKLDEVILAPAEFLVSGVDRENHGIHMICRKLLNESNRAGQGTGSFVCKH